MMEQLERLLDVDRSPAARLEYYQGILGRLKRRMVATMGTGIADLLATQAVSRVAMDHPIATDLGIEDGGVTFDAFSDLDEARAEPLAAACKDLVIAFFDILSELTGQVLTQGWLREIEDGE